VRADVESRGGGAGKHLASTQEAIKLFGTHCSAAEQAFISAASFVSTSLFHFHRCRVQPSHFVPQAHLATFYTEQRQRNPRYKNRSAGRASRGVIRQIRLRLHRVAPVSRLLKNISLFRKRALQKRPYSAKGYYIFKEPTNCSHPISILTANTAIWQLIR